MSGVLTGLCLCIPNQLVKYTDLGFYKVGTIWIQKWPWLEYWTCPVFRSLMYLYKTPFNYQTQLNINCDSAANVYLSFHLSSQLTRKLIIWKKFKNQWTNIMDKTGLDQFQGPNQSRSAGGFYQAMWMR